MCKVERSPGSVDVMKLPSIPAGEDEVSFQRHNCVMKAGFFKTRHNKQIVSELMNVTFSMHHADITLLVILLKYLKSIHFCKQIL